jgi:hypothetical protein
MLERLLAALSGTRFSFEIQGNNNQMYRLNLSRGRSPAGEYLAAGIPAAALRGDGPPPPETNFAEMEENFSAFFTHYLNQNSGGIPLEWDQHYFFFHFGGSYYIAGESVLIILLLGVLGLSMLYALIAHARVRRYIKTFLRNIWNLPLILFISMLFFMAGTLLVRAVSALRNTENLWTYYPFLFFILKTGFAAFLIIFAFHHLRRLPLSKNGSFYSAAAIFFFFANVLVFSAIDIAFSIFFLWAYTASLLFSLFKRRAVKVLLLCASPLLFYFLAYNTFSSTEKDFAGVLINSPFTGNLLLSFIFFPFFLMAIRIDLLLRHPHKKRSSAGLKILLTLSGTITLAAAVFILAADPWRGQPQPLAIEEYWDVDKNVHELRLSSPSSIGNIEVSFAGKDFSVNAAERAAMLPLDAEASAKTLRTITAGDFLARRTYRIAAHPPFKPHKITLTLSSDSPLVIYDCGFPYSLDINGHEAEVFIGEDPPLPLDIVLTFPAGQSVRAELVSWFSETSSHPGLRGKNFAVASYSKIRDSFIIKSDD